MNSQFREFSKDIVAALTAHGYTSVKMTPTGDKANQYRKVELVPTKSRAGDLDLVHLDSDDINDYLGQQSPMAQYVIDIKYLTDPASA